MISAMYYRETLATELEYSLMLIDTRGKNVLKKLKFKDDVS